MAISETFVYLRVLIRWGWPFELYHDSSRIVAYDLLRRNYELVAWGNCTDHKHQTSTRMYFTVFSVTGFVSKRIVNFLGNQLLLQKRDFLYL